MTQLETHEETSGAQLGSTALAPPSTIAEHTQDRSNDAVPHRIQPYPRLVLILRFWCTF